MNDRTWIVRAECLGVECFYNQAPRPGERCWSGRRNRATPYTEKSARVLAYALAATKNKGIPEHTIKAVPAYEVAT